MTMQTNLPLGVDPVPVRSEGKVAVGDAAESGSAHKSSEPERATFPTRGKEQL